MKPSRILVLSLVVFTQILVCWTTEAHAVVTWTKYTGNPVLMPGAQGAWDAQGVFDPRVIKDGSTYMMWYTGEREALSGNTMYIGYAFSSDGTTWTKYGSNPVLSPSSGGTPYLYDRGHVCYPAVIKDGTTYKMWYSGTSLYYSATSDVTGWQIFYATSSDGYSWTKYNPYSPTLPKGSSSDWDQDGVAAPTVIYESGASPAYRMWYIGGSESYQTDGIGYAYSNDGINWTKYNNPNTTDAPYANSDPVLTLGPQGAWDGRRTIGGPVVIKEGIVYRMWYGGEQQQGSGGSASRIGRAWSSDGINWTKYAGNPVMFEGSTVADDFDEYGAEAPFVLKDGNTYKMWYTGAKDCDLGDCLSSIGYATSPTYPAGGHLQINNAFVRTQNTTSGVSLSVAVIPEGPSLVDINELKVTLPPPDGRVFYFGPSDMVNVVGYQFLHRSIPAGGIPPGTYTFSVTASNGESASKQLTLWPNPIPYPLEGSSGLDRRIQQAGVSTWSEPSVNQVYISGTTPTLMWKPYLGDSYYYRVNVWDLQSLAKWYQSNFVLGSAKDESGYLSATVPNGVLKPDTPYVWSIQVTDTDRPWSAYNQSQSGSYSFYTGTKSTTNDFLRDGYGFIDFRHSFTGGEYGAFRGWVYNLAPWDIETSDTNKLFYVERSGVSVCVFYPYSDTNTSNPWPFLYSRSTSWFPQDGTYTVYVYEKGTSNFDSVSQAATGASPYPQYITGVDMSPADNSYLSGTSFLLTWKSKGDPRYRVRVRDFRGGRTLYSMGWLTGAPSGTNMSVSVPNGILREYSPYQWWVEAADTAGTSITYSNFFLFMTGRGPAGEDAMVSWGTDKLATVFGHHGSDSGIWSYDGTSWTHLTTWIPDRIISWGSNNLAASFSNYGSGNGIWSFNGTSWSYLSSWVPSNMKAWGGSKLAATFINHDTPYGSGNGIWSFNGTSWSHLTNWVPQDMESWGTSNLAASFSAYSDNGIWSYNGTSWSYLTNWVPQDMEAWGSGNLAATFPYYSDGGVWSFSGSSWSKLSAWVPDHMVSWGGGNLAGSFSNYSDNGIWSYNGTSWSKLTDWISQGMESWGSGNLAAHFRYYSDGGVWSYNGSTWSKLTGWLPERAAPWGGSKLAGCFGDYSDFGIWSYNGTSWSKLTNWLPE